MKWRCLAYVVALTVLAGCRGELDTPADTVEPVEPSPDAAAPSTLRLPPPPPPPTGPSAAQTAPKPNRRAAVVGVGKRGRGYGAGPISTPIAAYFSTRQRVVFDIQIASAMKLYHATHEHFPESHEEFMEEIIKANSIRLPDLPSGDRYVYDPEKAATMSTYDPTDPPLMVETER